MRSARSDDEMLCRPDRCPSAMQWETLGARCISTPRSSNLGGLRPSKPYASDLHVLEQAAASLRCRFDRVSSRRKWRFNHVVSECRVQEPAAGPAVRRANLFASHCSIAPWNASASHKRGRRRASPKPRRHPLRGRRRIARTLWTGNPHCDPVELLQRYSTGNRTPSGPRMRRSWPRFAFPPARDRGRRPAAAEFLTDQVRHAIFSCT